MRILSQKIQPLIAYFLLFTKSNSFFLSISCQTTIYDQMLISIWYVTRYNSRINTEIKNNRHYKNFAIA